ncbi:MAG: hypothetical protein NT149_00085 [Candidatus Gottesmanbacteria bacterium]|nr:hypothetical protein [Candidatus Gottesmanbacteria bacterium]
MTKPENNIHGAVALYLEHLGMPVEAIHQVGEGFHATGLDIRLENGTHLFLRQMHPLEFGHDLPGDRIKAVLETVHELPFSLKTHGILGITEDNTVTNIPKLKEVLILSEFLPSGAKNFCENLRKPTSTHEEACALASSIEPKTQIMGETMAEIHKTQYWGPTEAAKSLYKRSTRAVIHNDELTAGVGDLDMMDFKRIDWMGHEDFVRLLADMERARQAIGTHPERLRQIHGDYWVNNLYFDQNDTIIVTDGRLNWGEPGIDAGWMVGEYLMQDLLRFGHMNDAFTSVAQNAMNTYRAITGDTNIYYFMGLPYAFQAFAEAVFTPNISSQQRRLLVATAVGTLQDTKLGIPFDFSMLNTYTARGLELLK